MAALKSVDGASPASHGLPDNATVRAMLEASGSSPEVVQFLKEAVEAERAGGTFPPTMGD